MGAHEKRKITNIHTSYHANHEQKEQVTKKKRKGLMRRLVVFGLACAVISFLLISTLMGQAKQVASKKAEKVKVEKHLSDLKKKENVLKEDISRLNDDEYLAKLARRDFFLSHGNEIIFSIPKKNAGSSSY